MVFQIIRRGSEFLAYLDLVQWMSHMGELFSLCVGPIFVSWIFVQNAFQYFNWLLPFDRWIQVDAVLSSRLHVCIIEWVENSIDDTLALSKN